ncbi:hypothetical protein [Parasphingorhabdus marina]|nr:hypothetical protein [Parasphingorhabdus marina]
MDEAEVEQLLAKCQSVVASSLPEPLDYGIFGDDLQARERTIITLISDRESGRPIAFNALPLMDAKLGAEEIQVVHLGLVMVDPNYRSGGLSWILYGLTCLLLFVRQQMRPLWISSVTQVPAVVGMVAETFDSVWPGQETTSAPTFAHGHVAKQIMRDHRHFFGVGMEAGFDDRRFIITNAYTGGSDNLKKSFESAAKHRDEQYNALCEEWLDYERGDDILQVGQLNLATARTYLMRSVPNSALPKLAVQLLVLGVQALLAPTIQWLAANKSLGSLRPAK